MSQPFDVVVVGAGLVGLSTAHALLQARPGLAVVVLEKEAGVARHQSGHNSGVLHSGLYYRPGSAKASYAVRGIAATAEFADAHGVAHATTGKLVVATSPEQLPRLEALAARGVANGVPLRRLDAAAAREIEPEVSAVAALRVDSTGLCDFPALADALAVEVLRAGGQVLTSHPVTGLREVPGGLDVLTDGIAVRAKVLVNCAGLFSDRVALMQPGVDDVPVRIVPFRGEYAELVPRQAERVRGLVYPVPDPALPFLGVHLTRGLDGSVHVGPNAVPALAREGYRWGRISARDTAASLRWPGSWRMARGMVGTGVGEITRSLSARRFAAEVARMLPGVRAEHLRPGGAGVRAQAVDRNGALVDDFLILARGNAVHVLNAPSPGATACLPIGADVAERALAVLDGR